MQVDVVEREIRFLLLLHLTDGLEPKQAIRILLLLHNMILRQQVQGQKEQWGRLGSKTDWRKKNLLRNFRLPPAVRIRLLLLRIFRAKMVRSHWKKKIRILLRWIGKKNRKKKEKEIRFRILLHLSPLPAGRSCCCPRPYSSVCCWP